MRGHIIYYYVKRLNLLIYRYIIGIRIINIMFMRVNVCTEYIKKNPK